MKTTHDISESIRYIGVDDLELDLFEGQYPMEDGISYNSYLILDEQVAIMDTADLRKGEEWLQNLEQALEGRMPDYLLTHHMEPDHASLIATVMERYPSLTLVQSAQAQKMMGAFFEHLDLTGRVRVVKEGDTLCLGSHTLQFVAAPMVHWPEVLLSYEQTEQVLFSADAFGRFGALSRDTGEWAEGARRYYFGICGKYGPQVQKLLQKAAALDVKTIAPLHGPVLTGDLTPYLSLYNTWSRYEVEAPGVLVAYASIYGGTAVAAERLAELLRQRGAKVVMRDLCRTDVSYVLEDAFRYGAVCVCGTTYDGGLFPAMHTFLHHLQIKNYQNRRFGIVENGSWAPMAGKIMRCMIEELSHCEIVEPMVSLRSRLHEADAPALEALADALLA